MLRSTAAVAVVRQFATKAAPAKRKPGAVKKTLKKSPVKKSPVKAAPVEVRPLSALPTLPALPNRRADMSEAEMTKLMEERGEALLAYETENLLPLFRRTKPFRLQIHRAVNGSDSYVRQHFPANFKVTPAKSSLQQIGEVRHEFNNLSDKEKAKYGSPPVVAEIDPKSLRRRIFVPPPKGYTRAHNVFIAESFAKAGKDSASASVIDKAGNMLRQFAEMSDTERQKYQKIADERNRELQAAHDYYESNNPPENSLLNTVHTLQARLRRLGLKSRLVRVRGSVPPAESLSQLQKQLQDRQDGLIKAPANRSLSGYGHFSKQFAVDFFKQHDNSDGKPKVSGREFLVEASRKWATMSSAEKQQWKDRAAAKV